MISEKQLTVNAAQMNILVDIAWWKGLFFLEALRTSHFPISIELRELGKSGEDILWIRVSGSSNPNSHRWLILTLKPVFGLSFDLGLPNPLPHFSEAEKKAPVVTDTVPKYERAREDMGSAVVGAGTLVKPIDIATSIQASIDPGARRSVVVKILGPKVKFGRLI
ncbi:unnamed protein product [Tuber aestivum]|uniref:Uncharacterized protein n=1 Tax=Tuber aestivum TaxID=59557 RepID=A0A292PVH7_9PEZI|nr:unnamed protein product [Tuber aestivum]